MLPNCHFKPRLPTLLTFNTFSHGFQRCMFDRWNSVQLLLHVPAACWVEATGHEAPTQNRNHQDSFHFEPPRDDTAEMRFRETPVIHPARAALEVMNGHKLGTSLQQLLYRPGRSRSQRA